MLVIMMLAPTNQTSGVPIIQCMESSMKKVIRLIHYNAQCGASLISDKEVSLMIPANKARCPSGWTREHSS